MRFIASFNTLTTLIIQNSGQCREGTNPSPALPGIQLKAILKHKELETLDISHAGAQPGFRSMFQSAGTIRATVSGLPRLRVLMIAPTGCKWVWDEIAMALANRANLESLTVIPGVSVPRLVLPGFLRHSWPRRDGVSRPRRFVWEEHYRVRRISNGRNVWRIGSSRGTERGIVETFTSGDIGEARREVFARDISDPVADSLVESGRQFEWVDAVAKDTSWMANGDAGSPLDFEDIRSSNRRWEFYIPTDI
ncbi:hypothetical protein PG985_000341 [Apiospora marii]|uniref:Uncharacterized protein n=1 Tax=Apiospora marii TaxID=335849 RepID=A0ABR1R1U8_9PEZI